MNLNSLLLPPKCRWDGVGIPGLQSGEDVNTALQCSGGGCDVSPGRSGYSGASGVAGTVPGTGGVVVGVGEAGVWVRVCGPRGPPGPSGSTIVVVGVGDVGLVGLSPGDGVVVSVGVVVGVVVVVTASLGRRTFVRGTQV